MLQIHASQKREKKKIKRDNDVLLLLYYYFIINFQMPAHTYTHLNAHT